MESTVATKPNTAEEAARFAFDRLNRHDLSAADQLWGPDSVDEFVPVGEFHGTQAIKEYFEGLFAAVPDFEIHVDRVISQGLSAVVQWHCSGTFTGEPFLGIEPTGRRIHMRGVDVMEFDDQLRLKHNTIYYDGAEFARQVGMLPARDSTLDRLITEAFNGVTKLRRTMAERF